MGEYDNKFLKKEETKLLVHIMKKYYRDDSDETRTNLLNTFTKTPNSFKHMDIVDNFKKMNLTVEQFKDEEKKLSKEEEEERINKLKNEVD
jgi:hypothetical protein